MESDERRTRREVLAVGGLAVCGTLVGGSAASARVSGRQSEGDRAGRRSAGRTAGRRSTDTTSEPRETPEDSGAWRTAAPLPAAQSDTGSGVLDGRLYCFGGFTTGTGLNAVARTFAFDPADGERGAWERLADLPKPRWAPCGVAAAGKLFSFGGAPPNSPYRTGEPPGDDVFVYRPGEGWTDLTAERGVRCPYPNWAMGGAYDPETGLVYCVGGGTNVTDRESATNHGVARRAPGTFDERRVWTFDPEAERVVDPDLARLPAARRWPTVAVVEVGGRRCLHAICGLAGTTGPTASNFRYDLRAGEWERRRTAPRAGVYATTGGSVLDGGVYLTHGLFWRGRPSVEDFSTVCHRYDPAADAFRTDLPRANRPRMGAATGFVDGTLYVAGGHVKRYDRDGLHDCLRDVEAFTPAE